MINKHFLFYILLCLFVFTGNAQNTVQLSSMDAGYQLPGNADIQDEIIIPVYVANASDTIGENKIEIYNLQGLLIDSLTILNSQNRILKIEAVYSDGNFIIAAGTNDFCGNKKKHFIQRINKVNANIDWEIFTNEAFSNSIINKVIPVVNNQYVIQSTKAIYITDVINDTLINVLDNVGVIYNIELFNNQIIVACDGALMSINTTPPYSKNTLKLGAHPILSKDSTKFIYAKSNFSIYKYNSNLALQDSFNLIGSNLNIGAPQHMDVYDHEIYMLDGDTVFTYDSTFSQLPLKFSIALRQADTRLFSFEVKSNRIITYGLKGHYFDPTRPAAYILSVLPRGNSSFLDLTAELMDSQIDTSYIESTPTGELKLHARLKYRIINNSITEEINSFNAFFYSPTPSCKSFRSSQFIIDTTITPGNDILFETPWLTFGPTNSSISIDTSNLKVHVLISAINRTDYGETQKLEEVAKMKSQIGVIEESLSAVSLYPNPFKDYLTIESKNPETLQLSIYNASGIAVFHDDMINGKAKVQIPASLPAGFYIVQVRQKNKSQRFPLIHVH